LSINSKSYTGKQGLQKFIFPEGITYNKKTDECRTIKTNPVLNYIAHLTRATGCKEKGASEFLLNDACLVAEGRVELPALGL
jgi:hypothetical protein